MRLASVIPAVALFLAGADSGLAKSSDIAIAYVDLNRALNSVEDGKAAKARLKRDFEGKQKKLDEMQAGLKAKKEEFDSRKAMMKPEIKEAREEELQRELMQLQQTYMQLQQELIGKETQLTQDIGGKLRKVIERIGDREGYALILNIGDTVLYHKRHKDITDVVVKEYNQLYGKK